MSLNAVEKRWMQHACFATLLLFWLSHKALNLFPPHRQLRAYLSECSLVSGDILLFSCSQLQDDNNPRRH